MKVWIQWARANPVDYENYDFGAGVNVIKNLPSKPEPAGGQGTVALDQNAGWIAAVNVQGVTFNGYEHYGLQYDRQRRMVTVDGWNDEPADNPDGPYAVRWEFEFPRNDPRLNTINTVQRRIIYVEPGSPYAAWLDSVFVVWTPYSEFLNSLAPVAQRRHCPWLSNEQQAAHAAIRNERVWDEWIESV